MSLIETMLKKGGLAPLPKQLSQPSQMVATLSGKENSSIGAGSSPTVATVATVAVANPKTDLTPIRELESWQEWQAEHPSTGTVPLSDDETLSLRAWLDLIGEHDKTVIDDVLSTCERFPDTKAHCLTQAHTTEARQAIAARAALEAAQERAGILEHDAGIERTEAERVAKLAEAFYNHLFAQAHVTGCCWAPRNRYCAEGLKLRDTYYLAAREAGKMT